MANESKGMSPKAQSSQSPKPQGSEGKKPETNGIVFGLVAFLTAVIIIAAVVGGAFYVVVHNNVNGLADKNRANIQKYPFLRWALPTPPNPEDSKYIADDQIRNKYSEMMKKRDELAKQLDSANNQIKELQKLKDEQEKLKAENEKLQKDSADKEKSLSDREKTLADKEKKLNAIIANGDKAGFKAYFEGVDKDTAQKIYADIIKEQKATDDVMKLAQIYESMEPTATAAILNQLGSSKIDMIVSIIKNMKKDVSAQVLAAMDASLAAKVSEKIGSP